MSNPSDKKDHWSTEDYGAAASFVPKLATKVVSFLAPAPTDRILDIGCGDGILTEEIAAETTSGAVVGVDSSPAMIEAATKRVQWPERTSYRVQDCTQLSDFLKADQIAGTFDKVFSNAALHWILREPSTRKGVFTAIYDALKPGGVFAFEMGGAGNVAEVHATLIGGLVTAGVPVEQAREASPWFFPSEKWMKVMLTEIGFEIEELEKEYRPTKLTDKDAEGKGGLEGWVRLMGAQFLEKISPEKVDTVVDWVVNALETVITRVEDGSQWIGYVRLRGLVRKPA